MPGQANQPSSVARVYMRVSTEHQDLERQESLVEQARAQGFYVAGIYKEKASGVNANRPELQRMIRDLQPGEVVVAERLDRITRLPLEDAERLIQTIRASGARLAIPDVVDLGDLASNAIGVSKVVLDAVQDMLMKIALVQARQDYLDRRKRQAEGIAIAKRKGKFQGKKPDERLHERIIEWRRTGKTIDSTARLCDCSISTVKRVWRNYCALGDQHKQVDAFKSP
ncbi:recombinase family protein [Carnimonas bestiolae]|uniref:recombinase family protein n=1 Tax=Carnimonas bestiolae TaxID=3402172 RepID=UPI003EDCADF5